MLCTRRPKHAVHAVDQAKTPHIKERQRVYLPAGAAVFWAVRPLVHESPN